MLFTSSSRCVLCYFISLFLFISTVSFCCLLYFSSGINRPYYYYLPAWHTINNFYSVSVLTGNGGIFHKGPKILKTLLQKLFDVKRDIDFKVQLVFFLNETLYFFIRNFIKFVTTSSTMCNTKLFRSLRDREIVSPWGIKSTHVARFQ